MTSKCTVKATGTLYLVESCVSGTLQATSVVLSKFNGVFKLHDLLKLDLVATLLLKGDKLFYYAIMGYGRNWFCLVNCNVFNQANAFIFYFKIWPLKFFYKYFLKSQGVRGYDYGVFDVITVILFSTHRRLFLSQTASLGAQHLAMPPIITTATAQ